VLGVVLKTQQQELLKMGAGFYEKDCNLRRICTFNLHGKQENDDFRFSRIIEILSELRPDLCALQEVIVDGERATAERLVELLEERTGERYYSYFVETHLFYETYPEGVAVLSRHPFRREWAVDLNDIPIPPLLPRKAAVVETELEGKPLIFTSVHLDHHKDPLVRKFQAEKLIEALKQLRGNSTGVILAGDFNDTEDSPVVGLLQERGFVDAYRAINADRGHTFPTEKPKMRIDYIFVKDLKVLSARIIMGDKELSDHFGVYTEVRI
jgi:maltose 6'-phosphate phosphatase